MATAKKYLVTFKDSSQKPVKVTAESMRRDGSGYYFFDKDGGQVASWEDGLVSSAMDLSASEEEK